MKRALLLGLWTLLFCNVLGAQTQDGPGRTPFGSYFNANVDGVNLYNGNVLLDIPLYSVPGRELSSALRLTYNSQGWKTGYDMYDNPYGYYDGGFRTASPSSGGISWHLTECQNLEVYPLVPLIGTWEIDVQWTDETGAVHVYTATYTTNDQDNHGGCVDIAPIDWEEMGIMGALWISSQNPADPSMARVQNGDFRIFTGDGRILDEGGFAHTRNGNFGDVLVSTDTMEDTLGRTYTNPITTGSGTWAQTYTFQDASGTYQHYTLNYGPCQDVYNPIDATTVCTYLLTSIGLPNMRSYSFLYDHQQGFLTQVTLPGGGYIAYDYVNGNSAALADNAVFHRRVSADGATENSWTYAFADASGTRTMTVTDPESHQIVHIFAGGEFETETDWKENSGASPSKIVQTLGGPLPSSIVTQIGSQKQQQTFTWSQAFLTESTQSAWYTGGSATPWTKTVITPVSLSGAPYNDKIPGQVELQEWNGSAYVTQGKTVYAYDEDTPSSVSGTVPHYETPTFRRNNVSSVKRYKDASNYVVEHFYYDVLGNVVQHVDARGKSTTFDFTDNFSGVGDQHAHAYPKVVTDALSHSVTTVYSFYTGQPLTVTDPRSQSTTITYDAMNRPLTIAGPEGSSTEYTYTDSTPKVAESVLVASGKYRTTETSMDGLGRAVHTKLSDPGGDVTVDTIYGASGEVSEVSQPHRSGDTVVYTQTSHDVLGRPVTITNPDSSTVTYAYSDNIVTQTDEAGNQRRYTSNAAGQLTKVEEPNPNLSSPIETDYSYYAFGPLYQVTQTGSLTRTFTNDWLGRVSSESHPESGTTLYTYDDGGLVTSRTDARSIETVYGYDDIGRLRTVVYSDDTPDVTYTYTDSGANNGLLTSVDVIDNSTSTPTPVTSSSYTYDGAGQILSEVVTLGGISTTFTTGYTYDLSGRLLTETYPSGRVVTQTYAVSGGTAGDRLASLHDGSTNTDVIHSTADNAAGALTSRTLSSGITEARSFNPRNQLTHVSAAANSATLLDLGYSYGTGNNGKIQARTDAVQPELSANYTFDPIGRLTAVSGGDSSWDISWTLDAYGNRQHQMPGGLASSRLGTTNFDYTNNKDNDTSVSYDAAGNFTYDLTNHYEYDAENRLYHAYGYSGEGTYAYDAAGRRIKKTVGSVTTYYFYGLTGLMSEFSTDTGATHSNHTAAASTDRLQYRIGEQTGTGVMLIAADGTPRENNRVLPFGEPWNSNAGSDNAEKFTTYQRDGETDLDYAMARYYAARSGRFMTPDPGHVGADPSNPQSWNPYIYALNDPVDNTDPGGEKCHNESGDCGPNEVENPCLFNLDLGKNTGDCPISWDSIGDVFGKIGEVASGVAKVASDFALAPRDSKCLAKWGLAGAGVGTVVGATGGLVGLVGGPAVLATEPAAIVSGASTGGTIGTGVGMIACMTGSGGGGGSGRGRSTAGNMQKQVERGQAPKSVDRVDTARFPFEKDHVEFKDGTALNHDGTWKHGNRLLGNVEKVWLEKNGWSLPK